MPSAASLRYRRTHTYRNRRRREIVSRLAYLAMAFAGFVLAIVIATQPWEG